MNFLLIGHAVVDRIIDIDHNKLQPGGIYYSVVSFLNQMNANDKLYLCSTIDKQNANLFDEAFKFVEKDFMHVADSIPQVDLIVNKEGEREECYSVVASNLDIPINGLDRFDGILINMVSGNDISLHQLNEIRKNYKGLIYFDVHTFSRGIDQNLKRIFKPIKDFNEWAKCIDILQANETELKMLSSNTNDERIVKELFSFGIKQIIITKSERGAAIFFMNNKTTEKIHINALKVNAINKVGCGDIFGAAYFYSYIKNKNIPLALERANLFAGMATRYSNTVELFNLKKDVYERFNTK